MNRHVSLSTPRVQNGTLYFVALLREELGRRIKVARVGAGLKQRELATAIGLENAQDISRYERGKVEVPSHRIDLIAEATGRPRSYFMRDPSEPDPTVVDEELEQLKAELAEVRRGLTMVEEVRDAVTRIEALLRKTAGDARSDPASA